MTNMAKNPVGFNQNIHMALKHTNPSAIAFLMDDMVECNGDYSWVDGIEFSALAETALAGTPIFYGGEIAEPLKRALDTAKIPHAGPTRWQTCLPRSTRTTGASFL